jgi:anti-sigma regulatory factor (Ser/Thr protein kinase)
VTGLRIRDDADVSAARQYLREIAPPELPAATVESAAIVVSELATNQVRYAGGGRVEVRGVARDGVAGLEIDAEDDGPGLADPTGAFAGEIRRNGTLGIGLAAVRRLSAEIDLDTRVGEGTRIVARLFAGPVRLRPTVTILGSGLATEPTSGDAGRWWRMQDALVVMLCDGLGHGVLARDESDRALAVAEAHRAAAPDAILFACAREFRGSRGAVAAVARVEDAGVITYAAVGNIEAALCRGPAIERIAGTPGFLGAPVARPVRPARLQAPRGTSLVFATDGVRQPHAACAEAGAVPAWALAQRVLAQGRRERDDAMVVVVR